MESPALIERRVLASQMGRKPRGRFEVAARCPYGYPQVIRVHPRMDGEPFPTLYWLTCPFLVKEVSRLEAEGWIKRLEVRLRESTDLRYAMEQAHDRYETERNALLASEEPSTWVGLSGRGIGGISDRRFLKCLHLHVAHALAGENPIGAMVLESLDARACDAKEVICSAYV
jgi:uncharacterized protein